MSMIVKLYNCVAEVHNLFARDKLLVEFLGLNLFENKESNRLFFRGPNGMEEKGNKGILYNFSTLRDCIDNFY